MVGLWGGLITLRQTVDDEGLRVGPDSFRKQFWGGRKAFFCQQGMNR